MKVSISAVLIFALMFTLAACQTDDKSAPEDTTTAATRWPIFSHGSSKARRPNPRGRRLSCLFATKCLRTQIFTSKRAGRVLVLTMDEGQVEQQAIVISLNRIS